MWTASALFLGALMAAAPDSVVEFPTTVVKGVRKPSSMEEALEAEASLSLVRRGTWAAEPMRRGAGVGRLLVTLDGARIQGACTDHMDPATSYVEPSSLQALVVESGGESGNAGGGVAGRVDIPQRRPPSHAGAWTATALAEAASNRREADLSVNLAGASERFGQNLSVAFRGAGDVRGPGGVVVPLSGGKALQASSRTEWRGEGGRNLSLRLLFDESRDVGYPGLPMDAGMARAMQAVLGFEDPGDSSGLQGQVYANRVDHSMDDTHRQNLAMHMDMPGEASTQGGWVAYQARRGRWGMDLKTEAWRTFQRAEMTMYPPGGAEMFMLTWPDASTLGTRADAGFRRSMTENVELRTGASLEGRALSLESALGRTQVRIVDPNAGSLRCFVLPGWSLGAAVALSESWTLDLGAARQSRAPDAAELWGFYLYRARDGRDQIGNASLAPEAWNKAEMGVGWKGRRATVHVKNWLALVEDAIETAPDATPTMTPGAAGTVRWDNRGLWLRRGIEIDASLRWSEFVANGDLAWMAVDGPDGRDGSQVPAPGGHLRLAWTVRPGRLEMAGLAEWAVPQRKVDQREGEKGSDGYFVPELEMLGQFPSQKTKAGWKLAFENPLDLEWRSHLDWGSAPRPGRGVKLSLWANL